MEINSPIVLKTKEIKEVTSKEIINLKRFNKRRLKSNLRLDITPDYTTSNPPH